MTINVQGAAAETEIAEQVAQLETQLASKPAAIVIAPLDGDAVIGVSEGLRLHRSGHLLRHRLQAYEAKTSFVGTSNEEAAYTGGVYGVKINGDKTGAVIIYGQEGDNTSNLRKAGYEKALAEAGITPLAELSGNKHHRRRHQGHGGSAPTPTRIKINLVLCMNDDTAIGALNAIEAAGAKGISVIGFDGNASAVELIAAGKLTATVAQQPILMGNLAVKTAASRRRGPGGRSPTWWLTPSSSTPPTPRSS